MRVAAFESGQIIGTRDLELPHADIHPEVDEKMQTLGAGFSNAVINLKKIIMTSPGFSTYAIHLDFLDRIATVPVDQHSVPMLEAALRSLHTLQAELHIHTEWPAIAKINNDMTYLKGFLEGRIFEKMNALERIKALQGYIWVTVKGLLDSLGIPSALIRN